MQMENDPLRIWFFLILVPEVTNFKHEQIALHSPLLFYIYGWFLQLVVAWRTARVHKGGEVSVIAKAHTDVEIARMKVTPFDESR